MTPPTLTLDCRPPTPTREASAPSGQPIGDSAMNTPAVPSRLLVIDDDPASVALFCEFAMIEGFETIGMSDPRQLEEMLAWRPDTIILDLVMPDVDGIEILRELKQRKCTAGLILVSGGDRRMLASAHELGKHFGLDMRGALTKPVAMKQLLALLQQEKRGAKAPAAPDYLPDEDSLRRAITDGQLAVEYQPQVTLMDGCWKGVEALVRWDHPQRGRLGPYLFVDAMEKLGLGAALSEAVLAHVVRDLPTLQAAGMGGAVFVNLPPSALKDVKLTDKIMARIDAAGIAHDRIGFELTETSLLHDHAIAIDILARLRLKNAWLAIDDFGTGHSTLEILHELPFTELKIDLSFVRRAETDSVARTIVQNSIRLGQDLNLSVVAEGIETASIYHWLRDQGCTIGQGYHIARPMAVERLAEWHREWLTRRPDTTPAPDGKGFADFDAPLANVEEDKSFCVFSVDDEPAIRHLVEHVLAGECVLEGFSSAQACQERLARRKPDLLLLDISMPGMSGLEFCRNLKEDFDTQDIPVLFISGEESAEARLAAYEVGGMDFIAKPFKPSELVRKVRAARRIYDDKLALREQAGFAQRTAFAAMSSMGELGVVIEFLRRSFSVHSASELADVVLGALTQYGLNGTVQIHTRDEFYTLSRQGENLPLEVSVLQNLRLQGRIFEFRNRSVYNYGRVSLMVNDMPLNDPDRCGRIRDNLAILAEGADARVQAIELDQANRAKQAGIGSALGSVNQTLERLYAGQRLRSFKSVGLIGELQEGLMKSFVHLGMTDSQEEFLAGMIQKYMERMLELNRQNDEISIELEALAKTLGQLCGS